MAREIMVTLDGQNYTVPALNIDQLEDVATSLNTPTQRTGFEVLKIALRRADPKPDMSSLAPTLDEIGEAVRLVLQLSGLQQPDSNPQPTTPHLVLQNP